MVNIIFLVVTKLMVEAVFSNMGQVLGFSIQRVLYTP